MPLGVKKPPREELPDDDTPVGGTVALKSITSDLSQLGDIDLNLDFIKLLRFQTVDDLLRIPITTRIQAAILSGRDLITANWTPPDFPIDDYELNPLDQMILLIGKRRLGKSWWVKDYLYTWRHYFPMGIIFSHTKNNGYWQQIFPNHFIFREFDLEVIRMVFRMQESRTNRRGINPYMFVLFDDMASDRALPWLEELHKIAMEGRHVKMACFFTTQHMKKAATTLRSNADKVVIFYQPNEDVQASLEKEYGAEFINSAHWNAFLDKHTRDNMTVVIDNVDSKSRGKQRYFKYKARDLSNKNFSLLCDQAWGNKRAKMLKEQREEFRAAYEYEESSLKRMKNASFWTEADYKGTTKHIKATRDEDFEGAVRHDVQMGSSRGAPVPDEGDWGGNNAL